MAIKFYNDGSPYRLLRKRATAAWVEECIRSRGYTPGDVSYVFCSGEKHLAINRSYLGHDYRTDVITFDYSDMGKGVVSGDIFIDPETVSENASIYGVAPHEEMRRVLIHGVMHLCGYGDKTKAEKKTMHAMEDECLLLFTKNYTN